MKLFPSLSSPFRRGVYPGVDQLVSGHSQLVPASPANPQRNAEKLKIAPLGKKGGLTRRLDGRSGGKAGRRDDSTARSGTFAFPLSKLYTMLFVYFKIFHFIISCTPGKFPGRLYALT